LNNTLSPLNDDEVRQIAALVETLEHSAFDFLQLELGDLKLTIGKGAAPPEAGAARVMPAALAGQAPAAAPAWAPAPAAPASTPEAAADQSARAAAAADGTVAIVAPMMGRFYAKPEPGAAPFVSVGALLDIDTTVCLIEVMKVFTAVRAEVRGVVTEVCVRDEQFVEYGQILLRVRPA
jgi:acetyl-CoA carboxylase biotin carboxyl carrier protein